MTAPAPSPESSGPPPAVASVESKRSLLGFYLATGVVCLLLIGLYFAWPQIKLRYAIHRLRHSIVKREDLPPGWFEWEMLCTEAARKGNRSAMDALINQGDNLCWGSLAQVSSWPAQHRATFYAALKKWPREKILLAIHPVAEGIDTMDRDQQPYGYVFDTPWAPEDFVKDMEPLASKSGSKRVRETAAELLDFVRKHFAGELAPARKEQESGGGGVFPGLGLEPEGAKK